MKLYIKLLLLTCLLAAAIAGTALAADKKFEVSLDKPKVSIGEKVQLGLSFYGTQSMPAPDLGAIDGLDIRYIGPSTMMTVLNGQVSSSITHMYSVQPLKIGKFQLGPFAFKFKADSYLSNMVFLESVEERVVPIAQAARNQTVEGLGLSDRLFVTLNTDKPAAYVNELIPVTVKFYVNRLNVSDIQLPTFIQEGFSKVEFKEPRQFRERLGGIVYDVLEFKTAIFGMRPGAYRLGPAKIKCNVMVTKRLPGPGMRDDFFGTDSFGDSFRDDFFTRFERYPMELASKDLQIVISQLPADGRPADFTGAVGDYQFIYTASPTNLKVGDPVTVRMDINGTGNFNTVLIPKLDTTAGFRTYEPQVKTEENRKGFTQVLIPESDQVTQIPKASFTYFDPAARQYTTITQGPIAVKVERGKDEAPPQVVGPSMASPVPAKTDGELGRDIIYIKESPGAWLRKGQIFFRGRVFYGLIIVPLVFLAGLYVFEKRRVRFRSDTVYAGRILALKSSKKGFRNLKRQLKSADQKAFYETLFKAMQDYLGYRLNLPPAGITSDVVERTLAAKGVDMEILRKVKNLFTTCDRARFAYLRDEDYKRQDDVKELGEIVKYFERKKL